MGKHAYFVLTSCSKYGLRVQTILPEIQRTGARLQHEIKNANETLRAQYVASQASCDEPRQRHLNIQESNRHPNLHQL